MSTHVLRILDKEKFPYVIDACRFYGIPYEIEEINDNIPTSGEQNANKVEGKPVLGLKRSN